MEEQSGAIVLFDGVCNLCNASVNFAIDRDERARFRFAPLQGKAGARLQRDRGLDPEALDSIVLVSGEKVHQRSGAVLRIAAHLGLPWCLLAAFLAVPAPLRDWVYGYIARRRYRWFGRTDACRVPTPELAARFLE